MGIKSLTYLIKQKCEQDCIETKKLYELSDIKVIPSVHRIISKKWLLIS